jgi:hypothetical protein
MSTTRAASTVAVRILLVAVILGSAKVSFASGKDRAVELFNEGRELLRNDEREEACARFRASFELDPRAGTLLNIADCDEMAGHLLVASQKWTDAAALAHATGDPREEYALSRAQAVALRIAKIVIRRAPGTSAELIATLDGNALAGLSVVSTLVDPGPHVVVTTAHQSERRERLIVAEGEERVITVADSEPADAAGHGVSKGRSTIGSQSAPSPSGVRAPWLRPVAYGLGALGIVGIGVGSYFGIDAIAKKNAADSAGGCSGRICATEAGLRLRGESTTAAEWSTVGFAIAGLTSAASISLLIADPRSSQHRPDTARTAAAGVVVRPFGASIWANF